MSSHPTAAVEFGNHHHLHHLPPVGLVPPGHLLLLHLYLQIGGGAAHQAGGRCTKPAARYRESARGSCPPPGLGPDFARSSPCSPRSLAAAAAFAWRSCLKLRLDLWNHRLDHVERKNKEKKKLREDRSFPVNRRKFSWSSSHSFHATKSSVSYSVRNPPSL